MTDGPYDGKETRLEASLGYYLSKARNVLAQRMDRAVGPLGLTSSQIGVILLLSCGRAHTPYEMSRAMSYDSGSMTRMLDRLEKKGFIARSRSDALAWCVRLVGKHAQEWLDQLRDAMRTVEEIRDAGPTTS